jgi:predicted site-specific integrase-resolvase
MSTLLTDSEAGDILKLTPRQVARLAKRGQIPSIELPNGETRFDSDDIRKWIETCKRPLASEAAK